MAEGSISLVTRIFHLLPLSLDGQHNLLGLETDKASHETDKAGHTLYPLYPPYPR